MDREQLLKELALPLSKKKINQLILDDLCDVKDLIDLSMYPDKKIAFHAAWILEYCIYSDPERFKSSYKLMLSVYLIQKNLSCQRHFTKILMLLTGTSNRHYIETADLENLIETTFELMINPETPVAVKVNCMDILFNMRATYDWISGELREQILFLLKDGTAAIQSRGRSILKQLRKS